MTILSLTNTSTNDTVQPIGNHLNLSRFLSTWKRKLERFHYMGPIEKLVQDGEKHFLVTRRISSNFSLRGN